MRDIKATLKSTGIYFDPDHPDYITADKIQSLAPPFLEFDEGESYFYADGVPYFSIRNISVRLYSDGYANDEKTVESALHSAGYSYSKTRQFIGDLELWETIYQMEA